MRTVAKLDGDFATAEDTAQELGVSASRLKELKQLASDLLQKRAAATRNSSRRSATTGKSDAAGKPKTALKRGKKSTHAHSTSGASRPARSS